ncbi:SDR family NAD(P)-dependent oxidoreductase [Belnapia sp. F-4-1]|uniref:SDR family NAD(P)-dependent oxidoreductase n=1 Tax=Belnapia sp. F-4-1 TaxID=1545443 RepID=UPI002101A496|nr:SDR family NAD(P)-dependent oxidoreductase [Belnapia sp. F-4-1]
MPKALIIGAGDGLSASLARLLAREGYMVALAARNTAKLAALAAETGAATHACDAADAAQVAALFEAEGDAEVVVYNPSYRTRGPIAGLDRPRCRRASRSAPSVASSRCARRRGACWPPGTAPSC